MFRCIFNFERLVFLFFFLFCLLFDFHVSPFSLFKFGRYLCVHLLKLLLPQQELSRALKRGDSRLDKSTSHNTGASSSSSSSHVPSLSVPGAASSHQCEKDDIDAEEYYGTPSKSTRSSLGNSGRKNAVSSALYSSPWMSNGGADGSGKNSSSIEQQESTYCNTPTGTFLPSSPFGKMSKVSATPTMTSLKSCTNSTSITSSMTPPRVDRLSKPARFKSAYERLFGRSDTSPNKTTEFVFGGVQRSNASPAAAAAASASATVDDRVSFSRESTTSPDYINSSQLCGPRSVTESLANSGSHYSSNYMRSALSTSINGDQKDSPTASSSYGYSNSLTGSKQQQTSVKYQSFYSEIRRHEKSHSLQQQML